IPIAVTSTFATDSIPVRFSKNVPPGALLANADRATRIAPHRNSSAPSRNGKKPGPGCPSTHLAPTCTACTITAAEKRTTAAAIKVCALRMRAPSDLLLQETTLRHQVLVHGLGLLQPFHVLRAGHELGLQGVLTDVPLPVGALRHLLHE